MFNMSLQEGIVPLEWKDTIPSCSDMLDMCASGVLICSTVSFSIFGDIPSTPGDLFSFILSILQGTTSGVTTNCLYSKKVQETSLYIIGQ